MIKHVRNIMIVDEEGDDGGVTLANQLEKKGYNVKLSNNGEKAWKELKKGNIEILISGIKATYLGGVELLRMIHENNINTDVIICTSYGDVESYIRSSKLGASEYLNKPVSADELEKIIKITSQRHLATLSTRVETEDRRKHPRFTISEPAFIINREKDKIRKIKGVVIDISLSGLLLESSCNLMKDEMIEIHPILAGKRIEASAVIRRVKKKTESTEEADLNHAGLEFVRLPNSDHDYIKVYLNSI